MSEAAQTRPLDLDRLNHLNHLNHINCRDNRRDYALGRSTRSYGRNSPYRPMRRFPYRHSCAVLSRKIPFNPQHEEILERRLLSASPEGLDAYSLLEHFPQARAAFDALRSFCDHTGPVLKTLSELAEFPGEAALDEYRASIRPLKASLQAICLDWAAAEAEQLEKAARASDSSFLRTRTGAFRIALEAFLIGLDDFLCETDFLLNKPKRPFPDPRLLGKIRDAAYSYNVWDLDKTMEELEKYSYDEGSELVSWMREQIDCSEFEALCRCLS